VEVERSVRAGSLAKRRHRGAGEQHRTKIFLIVPPRSSYQSPAALRVEAHLHLRPRRHVESGRRGHEHFLPTSMM